jgi:uncharacterized OB-fold protein
MTDAAATSFLPVAEGLMEGTIDAPVLIGSECGACGTVTFPRQASCPRCTSMDTRDRRLSPRGSLWTWTVQSFRPKSPPYAADAESEFEPYGVGYVELPEGVRVEARLTQADPAHLRIGMPMELTLIPAPGGSGTMTYAFQPIEEEA